MGSSQTPALLMDGEATLSPPLHCLLTFFYLPTSHCLSPSFFILLPLPWQNLQQPTILSWCQMTAARAVHQGGLLVACSVWHQPSISNSSF